MWCSCSLMTILTYLEVLDSKFERKTLLDNFFFYLSNMGAFRLLNCKPFTCTKISLLSNTKIDVISQVLVCI